MTAIKIGLYDGNLVVLPLSAFYHLFCRDFVNMSLFKARDWWNTKVGGDEDFDIGCMCIGNFNTNDGDQNTGSLANQLSSASELLG